MATDGVKIIDGDTAHDTYWGIMDMYDGGVDFDTINKEFPIIPPDFFDDFDNEIYVTACALALWEIGQLTDDKLAYVKKIIEKGACVKEWSIYNEKDGPARQKEIDKFWKKISQKNLKIRVRKKYRKITNFYFHPNDLLAFQLKDGSYRAIICATIEQYRGNCNYIFVPTTYNSNKKPNVENLMDKELLGRQIGSGYDQNMIRELQPGIERIWELKGGNCNFFFGIDKIAVQHKDLANFKDRFEKVGSLQIIEGLKQTGSFGYFGDFQRFEDTFSDFDKYISIFHSKKYPLTVLCER
jgi:hypothetical protein